MKNQRRVREDVLSTTISTTIIVAVLIALALLTAFLIPVIRQIRITRALDRGDVVLAEALSEKLEPEEQAEVEKQCRYIEAATLEAAGDYKAASGLYAQAGDYSDAADRSKACEYACAESLEQAGQWDAAEEIYHSLGAYSDSADHIPACRYGKALELIESGESADAALILDALGEYKDSEKLLNKLVKELTGIKNTEKALAAFRGMSREELENIARLAELRDALPKSIIDVGFQHTAGLGADGRVYACGDNSCGQCDTEGWSNVTAIAAGAWHTAALLSDGSVVCTGRNTEHQCDTGDWQNIIQIAAGDYATFGLRSDGTIVCTGYPDHTEIADWSDMTCISAGSYGIAAMRKDSSLWFYPLMTGTDALGKLESVALNTGYAVGITRDGHAVCSGCELGDWDNIIAISAGSNAILGLDADGHIVSHFFRSSYSIDFSGISDAVALVAGGTHYAFVLSDGSVQVFGSCESGEDDVQSWLLAVG